jgi:branched-chain amino acid transport system permease protein
VRTVLRRRLETVGVMAVVLSLVPFLILGSSYYESLIVHTLLIALLAVALNIVFGHTDQLFLFMGGLAGLGAYGTALLSNWTGVTPWVTLPIAGVIAGLLGLTVSWVSAKRDFTVVLISILTLNLQLVLSQVYVGARGITGGSTGFSYTPYLDLTPVAEAVGVSEHIALYYVVVLVLVGALVLYLWLVHSRFGMAFDAIREDEVASSSIGVDVVYYKSVAGFLSAFLFAVAGAFLAAESNYLLPSDFTFLQVDVIVLIVLVVGGLRTTLGPVIGAAIIVAIEEVLSIYAAQWQTPIFGLLLIALFLYFRQGVVRAVSDAVSSASHLPGREDSEPEPDPEPEPDEETVP